MAEEEMTLLTLDERRKYLKMVWHRYLQATRRQLSTLLTEIEQVTAMHRKSIIRLMQSASLERKKRRVHRPPTYGKEVRQVVVLVWESLDYICAQRLTPQLLSTARHLARFGELDKVGVKLTPHLEQQLASVSRATVQRMMNKIHPHPTEQYAPATQGPRPS